MSAGVSQGNDTPARAVGSAGAHPLTPGQWRLKRLLRALAIALAGALVAIAVLQSIDPIGAEFRRPPWIGGLLGGGSLVAALTALAAGDPRRRGGLLTVVAASLAVAATAQLAYLVAGAGSGKPLGVEATAADIAMIPALAVELVLAAALIAGTRVSSAGNGAPPRTWWSSAADAGLRPALLALAGIAAALAAATAVAPFVDSLRGLFESPLLSAHLAAAGVAAAGTCWYIATAIRERLALVAALVVGLAGAALGSALVLLRADRGLEVEALGVSAAAGAWLAIAIAVASTLALALTFLRRKALRDRLRPRFLGATEYRALIALADVLVEGPEEAVPPAEIAANVDRYFARIRARRRRFHRIGLLAMQLHPLLALEAPFSELDEETRVKRIEERFRAAARRPRGILPLRRYLQAMLRMATQLTYIGYYSDPRSFPTVGYRRFRDRDRHRALDDAGKIPTPGEHPLAVERPGDLDEAELEADFCVIGSGAAGAILAYRLAEAGSVIVLERGQYVEPREFNDDEVEMIGRLYGDGVFQQSEDFRFTVLQGSCVGGTTVVNNAVSIPLPADTLERWNSEHGAAIDQGRFRASTTEIERWLPVSRQDEGPANPDLRLNPSHSRFLDGVARSDCELEVGTVRANISGCLGCGYCNIGCRYGRKLSMLDTVLPWAQRDHGPERVRILAECDVTGIAASGDGRRRATVAEASAGGRRIRVRARKLVLAAGAVASPYLLLRSGVGASLPVGRRASFNMGAPLTAAFEEELDAYDGLQISHVGMPSADRGWVVETWWNPPVSQALNMPGWFDAHYENMRRYRRLMAVGALVGTETNGRIGQALTGGPAVDYVPTAADLRKLADGLCELGRILFAGGASEVMLNGWDYHRFTTPTELERIPEIVADPARIALGTGHPQGGNALGADPRAAVVDPSFRVHGYDDVYVCDASVFPTSITVNPQLTVMALAHYAAEHIAGEAG